MLEAGEIETVERITGQILRSLSTEEFGFEKSL